MQSIQNYINNCNRLFQIGKAREHSYSSGLKDCNKIINVLSKTDVLMKEIDEVLEC